MNSAIFDIVILTNYILQYILQYHTIIYPTETLTLVPRQGRIPKLKPIQYFLYTGTVFRIGFLTRNCYATRQQAKKKHIDNRYDYTLHATQDDKHHDNARTN